MDHTGGGEEAAETTAGYVALGETTQVEPCRCAAVQETHDNFVLVEKQLLT
jgi:hypothetical protein